MEPFRNVYNKKSIKELADAISCVDNNFNPLEFSRYCLKGITKLEMKERVIQISLGLEKFFMNPHLHLFSK